jgi:hypothetical protein
MLNLTIKAKESYEQRFGRAGSTTTSFLPIQELEEIGEFSWEVTVAKPVAADANWTEVLGLAPLPEPLKIELRLDDQRGAGRWQHLQVGDRVRFVGRLIGFAGPYCWVAAIRFDEDQASDPNAARERSGNVPAELQPTVPRR